LPKVRPVAAMDYFVERGGFLKWLCLNCIGIVPFNRSGGGSVETLFAQCNEVLDRGEILIFFPEGTRGEPEKMGRMKKGIYYLIKDRPDTQVTPVMMYGIGRTLPKGEGLFVPFNCDVAVGDPLISRDDSVGFLAEISKSLDDLSQYLITRRGEADTQ